MRAPVGAGRGDLHGLVLGRAEGCTSPASAPASCTMPPGPGAAPCGSTARAVASGRSRQCRGRKRASRRRDRGDVHVSALGGAEACSSTAVVMVICALSPVAGRDRATGRRSAGRRSPLRRLRPGPAGAVTWSYASGEPGAGGAVGRRGARRAGVAPAGTGAPRGQDAVTPIAAARRRCGAASSCRDRRCSVRPSSRWAYPSDGARSSSSRSSDSARPSCAEW